MSDTIKELAQKELQVFANNAILVDRLCWVCGFHGSIELHHIVPRGYGGTNGPQVSLCGDCHAGIDKLSNRPYLFEGVEKQPAVDVCAMVKQEGAAWLKFADDRVTLMTCVRAWALANVIYTSRKVIKTAAPEEIANKKVGFQMVMEGEESRMLKKLGRLFGLPQDEAVKKLIRDRYAVEIGSNQ